MKTALHFLLPLAILCGLNASGQFVKRTGEFKTEKDGETIFTLKDSTFFFGQRSEPLWFEASKRVIFDIENLSPDSTLPAGVELLNEDYDVIGETKQSIKVNQVLQFGGFRREEFHSGIITGFISTYDCYVDSRPEDAISETLLETRGNVGQAIGPLLSGFGFESENVDGFLVHSLLNTDKENYDERFPMRMLIVMRSSASIICIVSESEYIEAKKTKGNEQVAGRYVTWFQRPNPRTTEQIEIVIYHYLP